MQLYSGHDHCPADPVDDGWPCSVLPFNAGVRTAICVLLKHKKQGGFVLAYFGRVFSACCICGFYSILLLGSSSGSSLQRRSQNRRFSIGCWHSLKLGDVCATNDDCSNGVLVGCVQSGPTEEGCKSCWLMMRRVIRCSLLDGCSRQFFSAVWILSMVCASHPARLAVLDTA